MQVFINIVNEIFVLHGIRMQGMYGCSYANIWSVVISTSRFKYGLTQQTSLVADYTSPLIHLLYRFVSMIKRTHTIKDYLVLFVVFLLNRMFLHVI